MRDLADGRCQLFVINRLRDNRHGLWYALDLAWEPIDSCGRLECIRLFLRASDVDRLEFDRSLVRCRNGLCRLGLLGIRLSGSNAAKARPTPADTVIPDTRGSKFCALFMCCPFPGVSRQMSVTTDFSAVSVPPHRLVASDIAGR